MSAAQVDGCRRPSGKELLNKIGIHTTCKLYVLKSRLKRKRTLL